VQSISEDDIRIRLQRDNPWWSDPVSAIPEALYPRRVYFPVFKALALNLDVRRATVLLGPRRVGKTVIVKQVIHEAIQAGVVEPRGILYASVDTPVYSGLSLETFLYLMPKDAPKNRLVIFDEIQYLKDWEVHLKDLVDNSPEIKFIATGSAAAALRLKSRESGAGRFSEFMLPPLTFYEFLKFVGTHDALISEVEQEGKRTWYTALDMDALNANFVDYLNFGGYPEAVLTPEVRKNPEQFIRNDIIDKVLLKDLPSLYGIQEIQQLNRLFSFLAYNTGNEASLENISQEAGLAKPTIKKYIEYLESAFLIVKLSTIDDNCRTMQRERTFKIYLSNPSMRAALFAPVHVDDSQQIGHLTESAIISQWQHSSNFRQLRYARWKNEGEVDIVYLRIEDQKPLWAVEIRWSDSIGQGFSDETRSVQVLLKKHKSISDAVFTAKTIDKTIHLEGRPIRIYPSALYCYTVGRNITARLDRSALAQPGEPTEK
jgi:predicted AAA+ superfamily ATPase